MKKERFTKYLYYEFSPKIGFVIHEKKDEHLDEDNKRFYEGNYFNHHNLWRISEIVNRLNTIFNEFKYANE